MSERDEARAALESFLTFVETTPRQRSPIDVREETQLLMHLEFAWAFARVGAAARARALMAPALGTLREPQPATWVESLRTWLFRDADAKEGRERGARLRAAAAALYEGALGEAPASDPWNSLDVFAPPDRYLLGRLMEASLVLSPRVWRNSNQHFQFETRRESEPAHVVVRPAQAPVTEERLQSLQAEKALGEQENDQLTLRDSAAGGLSAVLVATERYKVRWPSTTDAFSTNTLCCLSALRFVDSVVFAIAEAVNPLPRER